MTVLIEAGLLALLVKVLKCEFKLGSVQPAYNAVHDRIRPKYQGYSPHIHVLFWINFPRFKHTLVDKVYRLTKPENLSKHWKLEQR